MASNEMYHDRKYFYKYVTPETAFKIFHNCKLKYSSPVTFNDPFDVQTKVGYDFEMADMLKSIGDEIYRLLQDENDPVGDTTNHIFMGILKARQNYKKGSRRIPKHVFDVLRKAGDESAAKQAEQYFENLNSWWRNFVKASRVFCVAEEHDNLLMWAHYAKDHTGAVIKFKCLRELDTVLCIAGKVDYVEKPPVIANRDEYIKYITGQDTQTINHDSLIYKQFLSKSNHWCYEKEWRVWKPPYNPANPVVPKDSKGKEILFYLEPFNPQEIHSIYFGCKMDDGDRKKIENELSGDFRHVNKYLCHRNESEYKLDFELIS
ncbi:DUF2971 domain-containing protein [Thermodesulfobacteriota bacterium]